MDKVEHISAFTQNGKGGNKAGFLLCKELPPVSEMLSIAAQVGYSETAFVVEEADGFLIRYYTPTVEVPFCGHATIASGAALAKRYGTGTFQLKLLNGPITVETTKEDGIYKSTLTSPPVDYGSVSESDLSSILAVFGVTNGDIDDALGSNDTFAGGNRHVVIPLESRAKLASLKYDFSDAVSKLKDISPMPLSFNFIYKANENVFYSRNLAPFAGIYEDPATGSAASAFGGLLRDKHGYTGKVTVYQGQDMGVPCELEIELLAGAKGLVKVSGATADVY